MYDVRYYTIIIMMQVRSSMLNIVYYQHPLLLRHIIIIAYLYVKSGYGLAKRAV